MKILFTLLSIDCGNPMYLTASKNLINEILSQTNSDILLSTNNVEFFNDLTDSRITIRNNIDESCKLRMGSEFNYNSKYHAFKDIPEEYDFIIYLDCDIKLEGWSEESINFLENIFGNHDFGATRLNCILHDEIRYYKTNENCLFRNKIELYKILESIDESDDIMKSQLPSEHFLIFKNNPIKLKLFSEKWKEMSDHLQSTGCDVCSWGDGFEIGISARYAGFHNTLEVSHGYWQNILGFKFNGNKF